MKILVVDEEAAIRYSLRELLNDGGNQITEAEHAPAALTILSEQDVDLVISDLRMPAMDGLELLEHVRRDHPHALFILMTAYGDERTAVQALQMGAFHYVPKPFDNDEIRAVVQRAREMLTLRSENRRLREELAGEFRGIIGDAPAMREVYRVIRTAGATDATVLVTGESGTGKELVARALHAESSRASGPFVALNCSALPNELIESELFGHVRGAFTGADRDRDGLFEAAHKGTLFLDEIGDLAAPAQAKLLRALEERVVVRVGANTPTPVDVRLIAATNRPLDSLISEGLFREDLLYRLKVVTIELPPLRERREDIPILASEFLAHFSAAHKRAIGGLSEGARRALLAYDWPGNVRELRNVMERAVVLGEGDVVETHHLPAQVIGGDSTIGPTDAAIAELPFTEARSRALESFERAFLSAALERHGGNISATARTLGMHRQSLQKTLRRLGISRDG